MTAYLQISFYIQETFVAPTQSKLTNCSGQFRDLQFGANGPRSLQPPTCFKAERHMCIRTCPNIAGLAGAMLHHLHNLCLPTSRIRNQIWDNYMQSPQFHPAQPKPNTLESGETTRRRASQNMTTSGQKREPSKQTRLSQVGELDGSADQSGHNNMKNERMIRGGAL